MTRTPHITPPSPTAATDEAEFIAALRQLKTWSGLSFRQLERRASATGDTLPISTAATMLGRNRLPRPELLITFTRACGLDDDAIRPWLTTRAAIADGTDIPAAQPIPPRPRSHRRIAIAAAALVLAFISGALTAGSELNTTDEQEIVIVTQ